MLLGAHPGHLVQKGLITRRAEWERGKREPEDRESEFILERGEKEREEREEEKFGRGGGRATWAC